eukprot:470360-Pelagomonas_calceolata.AAC.2
MASEDVNIAHATAENATETYAAEGSKCYGNIVLGVKIGPRVELRALFGEFQHAGPAQNFLGDFHFDFQSRGLSFRPLLWPAKISWSVAAVQVPGTAPVGTNFISLLLWMTLLGLGSGVWGGSGNFAAHLQAIPACRCANKVALIQLR